MTPKMGVIFASFFYDLLEASRAEIFNWRAHSNVFGYGRFGNCASLRVIHDA
jgi:hypothetical protein